MSAARTAAALLGVAALAAAAGARPSDAPQAAANNYMLHCMGCHVPDGAGSPGRVPSVRHSLARLIVSEEGRSYLVRVPGAAQSTLSDAELAEVLNWMVRNLSAEPLPAGLREFTGAEVGSYRGTPLVQVRATRQRLLAGSEAE